MVLNYCEWHMRHGASCQSSSSPVTPKCSIDCRPSTQVTTAYSRSRSTGTNYSQPSATLCEVHICVHPSRTGHLDDAILMRILQGEYARVGEPAKCTRLHSRAEHCCGSLAS